jgi:transcriptional regulator of arginine metabolism
MLSSANYRRDAIIDILASRRLGSQEELLCALAERGVRTTQPVLSRDLRALKVAKRDGVYQLLISDRVTPLGTLCSLLRSSCSAGENMVVVKCEPGAASAIARAIESEKFEGLLGSVAGDDTVFIAVRDAGVSQKIRERITELL